jgi:hypothetical protein
LGALSAASRWRPHYAALGERLADLRLLPFAKKVAPKDEFSITEGLGQTLKSLLIVSAEAIAERF